MSSGPGGRGGGGAPATRLLLPAPRSTPHLPPRLPLPAVQERFYFGDNVLPLFESGIPLLLQTLRALPDAGSITIAYPDEGARPSKPP